MTKQEIAKRRGPKTPDGKLAVSKNASKHGILSPRPVVKAFESEGAWKAHRESIIDSLNPVGGVEQALAERVALASWRLNRVVVYETERIEQEQEHVLEEVRTERERTLRFASLNERKARDIVRGSRLEDLVEGLWELSDTAIEILAKPEVGLEAAENARLHYEGVCAIYETNTSEPISRAGVGWVFDNAPELAVECALSQQDEELDEDAFDERVEALTERFGERLGEGDPTASEMQAHLDWLAREAGVVEELGADERTVDFTPGEDLLEKLHTVALHEFKKAEERAQKIRRQITDERRARILPDAEDLQKIARYEAHLSREMYRSLHELEALQTRRAGGASPLGRLDISS